METLPVDRRDEGRQTSPYRPDEEERRFYYSGVRGSPMLVARTSGEKWTKVTDPMNGLPESRMFFALKQAEGRHWYEVVQQQPVVAKKWHEGPALKQALVAHLSASCDWTSMQVMNCGSMSFHAFLPTVLLAGVALARSAGMRGSRSHKGASQFWSRLGSTAWTAKSWR